MTDHIADTQTTSEPAAAVAAPEATAAAPADFSAHPVWGKALETVPEILRQPGTPLYDAIQTSEREAQRAIESARGTDVPKEWRELAAEAQQMGVTVDELAAAYQGQQSLAQLLQNDPDAFVSELQSQVDALVASGELTRAEGRQVMAQGHAAVEQTDDLLTDEQRELRELKAWKEAQEARQQSEDQRRQQEQQAEQIRQQEEAASNAYFDAFDAEMEAAGIMVRGQDGRLVSAIPVETLKLIASTGAQLRDANPQLPNEQAVKQAFTQVKSIIEATGGKLAPAAPANPAVPVIGASSSIPTGQVAQSTGQPRSMKDRMEAALAEAQRLAGQG